MSVNHDQIQLEIPAYIARRLDEVTSRRVEDHLAVCTECEAAVIDGEAIVQGLRTDENSNDARLGHLNMETIRAAGRRGLESMDDAQREHALACVVCSHLIAVTRRRSVDRAPTPRTRWMIPLSVGGALGAVASLVVAILLGWGPDSTPGGPTRTHEPIRWLLLESSTRGSAGPRQLSIADAPYLPVGVVISLESLHGMPDPVEFSIDNDSGDVIWTARVERARLNQDLRSTGFISFLLPSSDYPAGRYRLRVEGSDLPFEFQTTSSRDGE